MNKAITDGLVFMPPAFAAGLEQWSSGDGTAGSPIYLGATNAAIVPADQDFGAALELAKTASVQKLRYIGQTPMLPGCYLRISARVKAISGNLPGVRVAGWAGGAGDVHVAGLTEVGPTVALSNYGEVVTVAAIVGSGTRTGVDMPWGLTPIYGHFGLDLTGANGGVVRIENIVIEDVTDAFLRKMMDWVDVRDYGAQGDGVSDDTAAFAAADAAAGGREVLVSAGTYYLAGNVTFEHVVRFEGTVVMPDAARLSLTRNFNLPAYVAAFGDETLAFRKAVQALFNFTDHDELDLGGLRVSVSAPIDVQAAVGNLSSYATRRVIRNGQLEVVAGPAWATTTTTSQASYSASAPTTLTGVANIANIEVGSLVTGTGVGREVYVRSVNVAAGTLVLSNPLYGAPGTQSYTFTRFRYMLDFSGFESLSHFVISDIDFRCAGQASAVMLAKDGLIFHVKDCFFTKPKDRGITSIGKGCQGMLIDRCQFLSSEQPLRAQDRTSIGFNSNANDLKIRDNRAVLFRHFAVMAGTGNMIEGNHWFQGDSEVTGTRLAGLVLTAANCKTTITGNYIDNNFIEWNNEHDATPDHAADYSFGNLSIVGNIFMASNVGAWFRSIVVKPYGSGHFLQGFNISGNVFKSVGGNIDRVEVVDSSIAPLDMTRTRNVIVEGNAFNGITQIMQNPVSLDFSINTAQSVWTLEFGPFLPFGGRARKLQALTFTGAIRNSGNVIQSAFPYAADGQGPNGTEIRLTWPTASAGKVQATARMDNPT